MKFSLVFLSLFSVGPLGICNTSDCTKAAKIKCLDCRNVAYCTKRCMVADAKDHKRNCFSKCQSTSYKQLSHHNHSKNVDFSDLKKIISSCEKR